MAQENAGKKMVWGVNGHPFTQQSYSKKTWNDQLSYLKDLGIDYYRIDMRLAPNGKFNNEKDLLEFIGQLKSIGVKAMPVLFPKEEKLLDSVTAYKSYFDQGKDFAKRYGDLFDVIEVGNEWEVKLIKSRKFDGTKASHYDLLKTKRKMWLLAGFISGLKAEKPMLRVSVSLGWTHWYYLDLLDQYRVDYDIIGYHWYSNMGYITNARKPYGNFLPRIKRKYNKEIWITEFNTFAGTKKRSHLSQQQYIEISLNKIRSQNIITGFFIYELFDQPNLREKFPDEPNYGLIFRENGKYLLKPAYKTFKEFVGKRDSVDD